MIKKLLSRTRTRLNFPSLVTGLWLVVMVVSPAVRALDSAVDLQTPFYDPSATGSSCVTSGGSVYKFVQTLAFHESGGDIKAQASTSDASGKYQYLSTTWKSHAESYYPPALQYATAKDAPESVQDALVFIEYSKKAIDFNSDIAKMAVSHIYPAVADSPEKWPGFVIGSNPTAQEYADKFVEQYNNRDGQNRPLQFLDAPDFQLYLAKAAGSSPSLSIVNFEGGCAAGVPAGSFVFYRQNDSRWGNHSIYSGGDRTIATSGCGPTSAAMVIASLVNGSVSPVSTADYMTSLGDGVGYTSEGATAQGLMKAVENWGLKARSLDSLNKVIETLKRGGLVIAGGAGAHPYSEGGHVVVLRGVNSNGNFLIGNPSLGLNDNDPDHAYPASTIQAYSKYFIGVTVK